VGSAIRLAVNPAVLRWARETSGATIEDAAKRLRVPPSAFSRWEAEKASLTLTQARSLASYFKRPLAAFLLPEPPREPGLPHDFRGGAPVRKRSGAKTPSARKRFKG
jgi:transcriptional regulator with XRE-family HTH domain